MKTYPTFYLELALSFITAWIVIVKTAFKIAAHCTTTSDVLSFITLFIVCWGVVTCCFVPVWYGIVWCIRWMLSKTKTFKDM